MESSSLHVLPLSATHHNIDITYTWLDLILTSSFFFVRSHGQHKIPGFSQYVLIYLSYALKLTKPHAQFRHIRYFGRMNEEKQRNDGSVLNWEPLLEAHNRR